MSDAPAPAALTRADRETMFTSVGNLVKQLVRRSGLPPREFEDAEQEVNLVLWKYTEKFDPTRGVMFSTYAHRIVTRTLGNMASAYRSKQGSDVQAEPEFWDYYMDPASLREEEADATAGQLYAAVQRQLATGLLDALNSDDAHTQRPVTLSGRTIVERVAFEGLTCQDVATQAGQEVKVVKANLKNAIRKLKRKGLLSHVATDAHVEAILAPDAMKKYRNKPKTIRSLARAGVGQEPSCSPTPAEAEPCHSRTC